MGTKMEVRRAIFFKYRQKAHKGLGEVSRVQSIILFFLE